MSKNTIQKVAVDSVAEKYWTEYFKDTGYGKLWVRKIPMKLKAELEKGPKTASKTSPLLPSSFRPIASVITDSGVSIEGLATYANKEVKAFVVDFDHEGNVTSFDSVTAVRG